MRVFWPVWIINCRPLARTSATAEALPLLKPDAVAGFPSPADGFSETPLNLQQLLIQRPAATYFIRVHGHSMTAAGIFSGDLLIVDRSLVPGNNTIVVAIVEA